jgi:hypothetical protein
MTFGTMERIQTVTVGSGGAATIEFTSIPQTYNDLKIVVSARTSTNDGSAWLNLSMTFNNSATSYSGKLIYGNGTSVASINEDTTAIPIRPSSSLATASTFGSAEVYIPNYGGSTNKSFSIDNVSENNATAALQGLTAGLWSNTSAITSIKLTPFSGNLVQHSTATLYGITRVPAGAKATGGVITDDASYWYHTFTTTGVFTPSQNLTCDYLVVAGGGGGGYSYGSGGGAGGLRSTVGATGGGGALESPISVTGSTNYTITVGAGGTGGGLSAGTNGSNSVFSTITSTGGGRGGSYASNFAGGDGGSGGGGRPATAPHTGGAANPSGQGYKGGDATGGATGNAGAGGGGAGAAGTNQTTSGVGTNGGVGLQLTTWSSATFTGVNDGYYAGGGGGGSTIGGGNGTTAGTGGLGGGGAGSRIAPSGNGVAGTANTGGGGGGSGYESGPPTAGNGGSGIVIVRYAK